MALRGIDFAKQTGLYREKQRQKVLLKNLIIFLVIIGLAGVSYVVAFIYKKNAESQIDELKSQITQRRQARNYNQLAELIDTASRLNFASEMKYKQRFWSGFFQEISSKILPSLYLESWEGSSGFASSLPGQEVSVNKKDGDTVSLKMVAPTLTDIGKQIFVFKGLNKIDKVTVSGFNLSEKGIDFSLDIVPFSDGLGRCSYPVVPTNDNGENSVLPSSGFPPLAP